MKKWTRVLAVPCRSGIQDEHGIKHIPGLSQYLPLLHHHVMGRPYNVIPTDIRIGIHFLLRAEFFEIIEGLGRSLRKAAVRALNRNAIIFERSFLFSPN